MQNRLQCFVAIVAVSFCGICSAAQAATPHWVASWGSSQMRATGDALPSQELTGTTLRQIVHLSVGGDKIRLHLSNAFGESPLVLDRVSVARRDTGGRDVIQPATKIAVRFGGRISVSIPMGAEYLSDEIALPAVPLSDLVITVLVRQAPATVTFHAGARATSYVLHGDHVADARLDSAKTVTQWYFLAGVEVANPQAAGAVVALGDSITDGRGVTTDANERWTDVLAQRSARNSIGVVNQGIGGNRILEDGLGPNALSRFVRDVLAIPGAHCLIVLEGVNDLGVLDRLAAHPTAAHEDLVNGLENALRQMVELAHAHGLRVLGGTVMPFQGSEYYHPSEQTEADRQQLNQWIRTSGIFDGIVDFDQIMRDPSRPGYLAAEVDSGDHLHPNPAGYKRMGEAIPLNLLQ
ncbi:SGNH/GDSL hydrolase family protein [Terriglobus albidus]|uniref:SGNH/GDSL hydrolase family protein n=1 Tax=Terriglobus albidus TaxID=1592106 RepID=UPI001C9D3DBF|nr:SGNH/GDSL hydrolase family protein [Terriglobus albidus]